MRCRISLNRLKISQAFASRCKFRIPFITNLLLDLYMAVINREENELFQTVTLSF